MAARHSIPAPEFTQRIVFEKVVPTENCYRQYTIALAQADDKWAVVTRRGRIDGTQRVLLELAPTHGEAYRIAQRRAHDRLLHEYHIVHIQ